MCSQMNFSLKIFCRNETLKFPSEIPYHQEVCHLPTRNFASFLFILLAMIETCSCVLLQTSLWFLFHQLIFLKLLPVDPTKRSTYIRGVFGETGEQVLPRKDVNAHHEASRNSGQDTLVLHEARSFHRCQNTLLSSQKA